MYKKVFVMAVILSVALFMGLAGCAKKNVKHLASDASLVTPGKTTKEQVLIYLGQPDEQHAMAEGSEAWIYYNEKKDLLHDTPYIGDRIGEKKYEMIKILFGEDVVQTCVYRLLTEEEFEAGGLAK